MTALEHLKAVLATIDDRAYSPSTVQHVRIAALRFVEGQDAITPHDPLPSRGEHCDANQACDTLAQVGDR